MKEAVVGIVIGTVLTLSALAVYGIVRLVEGAPYQVWKLWR